MAASEEMYEYKSEAPRQHPTGNLAHLRCAAEKLRAHCTQYAPFGMHQYAMYESAGETIVDQEHPDDVELAEAVIDSLGNVPAHMIKRIIALVITDEARYARYLASYRDELDYAFHTDWRMEMVGGKGYFYPALSGRMVLSLFDDGCTLAEGLIQSRARQTRRFVTEQPNARSSQIIGSLRGFRGIIVGEDGHFLRGPIGADLSGDIRFSAQPEGIWHYWHPSLVHAGRAVDRPGRVQIYADLHMGHDPYPLTT